MDEVVIATRTNSRYMVIPTLTVSHDLLRLLGWSRYTTALDKLLESVIPREGVGAATRSTAFPRRRPARANGSRA